MTSDLTSDGVGYPPNWNLLLGNHYTYFGILSVSPKTSLNYLGSAATADDKLLILFY